jgi:uncharacterized protein YkwD
VTGCSICGEKSSLLYDCNYCTGEYCSSHRLPENHNCPGLENAGSQGPDFRNSSGSGILGGIFGSDDSGTTTTRNPGSTEGMEPSAPSPDVNPDGTISNAYDDRVTGGPSVISKVLGYLLLPFLLLWWAIQPIPAALRWVNRRLFGLVSAAIGAAKLVAPALVVIGIIVLVAGQVGTGVPVIDNTSDDGIDVLSSPFNPDYTEEEQQLQQAIHERMNEVRAENGVQQIRHDSAIAGVAQNHSEDMRDRDFFSHKNPDGDEPQDRLRQAGVTCRASGENLAYREDYSSTDETAEAIVEQLMNSPGHRENILREGWSSQGIGVEIYGSNVWVTQVFCGSS